MKTIALLLLKTYKIFISPLLGQNCKFTPTCSSYAIKAITKYGFLYGSYLSLKRILRCNPWTTHSHFDDVP